MNREGDFFKDTKFFHDIFHSYNHKCGDTMKSEMGNAKNPAPHSWNTVRPGHSLIHQSDHFQSICEQFNAYIGIIAKTVRHMTVFNAAFCVQAAIHEVGVYRSYMLSLSLSLSLTLSVAIANSLTLLLSRSVCGARLAF